MEQVDKKITVFAEATPNPHSMKFTVNQKWAEENWETENIAQATRSPLAQKILGFPWAVKVFIGSNFITVNKENWVEWDTLKDPLSDMIQEHIESGQAVLLAKAPASENSLEGQEIEGQESNSPITQQIKRIIDETVQPAVAMDGGFIAFAGYKEGTVFLKMQGACAGCPSSSITLKQGIESHLKSLIPEVQQVVAI